MLVSSVFLEFLIISVLSLVATFVLFKWLTSYAHGKTKFLSGSIRYGGAVAGFVLIFVVLFYAWAEFSATGDRTEIDLAGKWNMRMVKTDQSERAGLATIRQSAGSTRVSLVGEVESRSTPPSVSFHTLVGVVRQRQLVILWENSRGEMGIALGTIQLKNGLGHKRLIMPLSWKRLGYHTPRPDQANVGSSTKP